MPVAGDLATSELNKFVLALIWTVKQDWGNEIITTPHAVWRGQLVDLVASGRNLNANRRLPRQVPFGSPYLWNDIHALIYSRSRQTKLDRLVGRLEEGGLVEIVRDKFGCSSLDLIAVRPEKSRSAEVTSRFILPVELPAYGWHRQRQIYADWLADQRLVGWRAFRLRLWHWLTAPRPRPAMPKPLPEPFHLTPS